MVGFAGSYHAILGRPCYAKFMAIPNYVYLKLKMPGPKGIITVGTSYQHAYQVEVECCEHVAKLVATEELLVIQKELKEAAAILRELRELKRPPHAQQEDGCSGGIVELG